MPFSEVGGNIAASAGDTVIPLMRSESLCEASAPHRRGRRQTWVAGKEGCTGLPNNSGNQTAV